MANNNGVHNDGNEPFLSQTQRRAPRPPPPVVPPVVAASTDSANTTATDANMPATFNPFSQAPPLELPQSYARSGYSDLRTACSNRYRDAGRTIDELLDQEEVAENKRRQDRKEAEARIAETMQRNPNISRAPKRISFMPLVERLRIQATKIKEDYERAIFVPRLSSSFGDPSFNDRTRDGEQVFRQILKAFVSFPDPPTPFQHKLFAACASACAPMIFGEEFFSDPTRCLSIIGGRYTDGIVGVLTGRKTGKSTGLAYIAIAFMFVIKNWKGIIVSKTLEQAKIILDTIKGLIQVHPLWAELGFKVVESRATALVIQSKDRSLRWIESRCGSGEEQALTVTGVLHDVIRHDQLFVIRIPVKLVLLTQSLKVSVVIEKLCDARKVISFLKLLKPLR